MLTYYHLWKMNPTEARRLLIKDYQETKGYSRTARLPWHVAGQGTRQGLPYRIPREGMTGQGTRARFISFSFQNTKRAPLNFLEYLFSHVESHGAPFEETIYSPAGILEGQADWGAEYGGFQTKSVKRYGQDLDQLKLRKTPSLHPPPYQEGEIRG